MRSFYKQHIKIIFDLVVVAVILVVGSPFIAVLLIGIMLSSGDLILLEQTFLGLNGRPFTLYRFNTLRDIPELPEERKFWWGSLLRFTMMYRFPELFNVIKGDMSLIGPEPLPVSEKSLLTQAQCIRFSVKPGIISFVEIKGGEGVSRGEQLHTDIYYAENVSSVLDLFVLIRMLWPYKSTK